MSLCQKIALGIATTLAVATVVSVTEVTTMRFTGTADPRNLYTYISFKSFAKKFDNRNQESFKTVSEFVNSDNCVKLVAQSHKVLIGNGFVYTYKNTRLYSETDQTELTNWDAVRKYMQIETELEKSRKTGTPYYLSNA